MPRAEESRSSRLFAVLAPVGSWRRPVTHFEQRDDRQGAIDVPGPQLFYRAGGEATSMRPFTISI